MHVYIGSSIKLIKIYDISIYYYIFILNIASKILVNVIFFKI